LRQALLELEEVQKDSDKHLLPCSFTLGPVAKGHRKSGETGGRISEMKQKVFSVLIVLLSGAIFLGCSPTPGSEEASSSPVPTFRIPSQQGMPPDIDPESRSRLPLKHREDLDADGQDLYDFFVNPASRTEGVMGPRGFYLYSTRAGRHLALANEYLRFESGLDARTRELAILLAVREMNGQYQWTSHEPTALEVGLEPEVIEVVKYNKEPEGLKEQDTVLIRYTRELLRETELSSETFSQAVKEFGEDQLVTLTFLIGNYVRTSLTLKAVNMQLASDREPLLPMPE